MTTRTERELARALREIDRTLQFAAGRGTTARPTYAELNSISDRITRARSEYPAPFADISA